MWFKNLQLYRLPAPWDIPIEKMAEQLERMLFQPCGSQDMQSRGWVPPREGVLVHSVAGQWLVALRSEQKLLPSSVVNQFAQERAEEIEAQQGYKPGRKQMKEIKEAVLQELLPRAFARRRTTYVWIDTRNGWLAVDAPSSTKADEVLEALIKTLDDLPIRLLKTQRSPASAMTEWLVGEAPPGFTVDRDCELRSAVEEKSAVRYVRHPLEGDEVRHHITEGKFPTRLALTWADRISFVLTEKLEIKKLGFLDVLQEEAESQAVTADEQFDADFALMSAELARFLPDLVDALGGEEEAP